MKNKKKILIISVVVALVGLWALGYSWMKKNDRRIRDEAVFKIVSEYVQTDSDFISKYGKIQKITLSENESIAVISAKKCQVPCVIITENEKAYLAWIEYDFSGEEDVFKYISVTLSNSMK